MWCTTCMSSQNLVQCVVITTYCPLHTLGIEWSWIWWHCATSYIFMVPPNWLHHVIIIPHWVLTHMGNLRIGHVRPSVRASVRLCVRPSDVISQRWLNRFSRNRTLWWTYILGWCPSCRNFKILNFGEIRPLFHQNLGFLDFVWL